MTGGEWSRWPDPPAMRRAYCPEPSRLRAWRRRIAALYCQLEAMGVQHLRARTNPSIELKLRVALLAVTITNAH